MTAESRPAVYESHTKEKGTKAKYDEKVLNVTPKDDWYNLQNGEYQPSSTLMVFREQVSVEVPQAKAKPH